MIILVYFDRQTISDDIGRHISTTLFLYKIYINILLHDLLETIEKQS